MSILIDTVSPITSPKYKPWERTPVMVTKILSGGVIPFPERVTKTNNFT